MPVCMTTSKCMFNLACLVESNCMFTCLYDLWGHTHIYWTWAVSPTGGLTGTVCPCCPGPPNSAGLVWIRCMRSSVTFQSSFFKGLVSPYFSTEVSLLFCFAFYAADRNNYLTWLLCSPLVSALYIVLFDLKPLIEDSNLQVLWPCINMSNWIMKICTPKPACSIHIQITVNYLSLGLGLQTSLHFVLSVLQLQLYSH